MSCYSIVKLNLDIKASPDEIEEALKAMGFSTQTKSSTAVVCGGMTFSRADANSAWSVTRRKFRRHAVPARSLARAKVLNEAKRQGYQITA